LLYYCVLRRNRTQCQLDNSECRQLDSRHRKYRSSDWQTMSVNIFGLCQNRKINLFWSQLLSRLRSNCSYSPRLWDVRRPSPRLVPVSFKCRFHSVANGDVCFCLSDDWIRLSVTPQTVSPLSKRKHTIWVYRKEKMNSVENEMYTVAHYFYSGKNKFNS